MKKFLAVAVLLLTVTVACGKQNPETAATAPPPPPVTESAQAPDQQAPAATSPADDAKQIEAGEAVSIESEEQDTPIQTRANVQLAQAIAPSAPAAASRWQQGQHYKVLTPAQPTSVSPDKVEVVEVFWYACPHCRELEPAVENFIRKKPAYVQLTRVHVTWGPVHKAQAQLYYTLAALGKAEALQDKVYTEVQTNGNMLASENPEETERMQTAFAARNGIRADDFRAAYRSMGVMTRLRRAEELVRRYQVAGVPFFIVNGKYTTDVTSAGGQDQLFALLTELAAREQKKQ